MQVVYMRLGEYGRGRVCWSDCQVETPLISFLFPTLCDNLWGGFSGVVGMEDVGSI
jgi:hypothetical protein